MPLNKLFALWSFHKIYSTLDHRKVKDASVSIRKVTLKLFVKVVIKWFDFDLKDLPVLRKLIKNRINKNNEKQMY